MASSAPDTVLYNGKEFGELLNKVEDCLSKAVIKNNTLLESLETVEARAIDTSNGEISLLRNLRARLSATHQPNAELRKCLPQFSGVFQKRFKELSVTLRAYKDLNIKLQQDAKDLEDHINQLDREKESFENERSEWKRDLEQARKEITEQNDRLTFLSQQISGEKNDLQLKTNELANRRIAFEEEKLLRETEGIQATNNEAETMRKKLREQVLVNVKLEESLLKMEVTLHQRNDEILKYEDRVLRQQREIEKLKTTSAKAVKQFENRTKEANAKLSEMNAELERAQEHAHRFQDLLTMERRKQKALQHALDKSQSEGYNTALGHRAYIAALSDTVQHQGKTFGNATRVEDVLRKSESVLVENASLKAEIQKLRVENSDLMKRVKFSDSNAHYMRNQVLTNLQERAQLLTKLHNAEDKISEYERSLKKQASEWVQNRKQEEIKQRKTQMRTIQPISPLGGSERTWNVSSSGPPKVSALSRGGIQVSKWGN